MNLRPAWPSMLSFLDASDLDLHIALLAEVTGAGPATSQRRRYLSALARLAFTDPRSKLVDSGETPELEGESPLISADMGPMHRQVVATTLGCDPGLVPALDGPSAKRARRTVEDGLQYVRSMTPYGELIDTLVGRVVLAGDTNVGASSSRAHLGFIVMCPPSSWDHRHSAVSLVHEATHQALFLADLVRRVFRPDPGALDGMTAISAVRGVARPYDLAFHSAAVAVATGPVADDLGVMQPERARVERCLDDLRTDADRALTTYGNRLLGEIEGNVCTPGAWESRCRT